MTKKNAPQAETQQTEQKAPGNVLTPVGKITVAQVFGKIKVADLPEEGETEIMRVAGYASSTKSGTTQYGEWHALQGEFAATNLDTGEVFISKTCIVPGPMGEALIVATEKQLAEDASSKVAFKCIVSVKRSPRNPEEKYEYVVRPEMEVQLLSPALTLLGM